MIETFKVKIDLSGGSLRGFLVRNNLRYNLHFKSDLFVPSINNVFKGQISFEFFGSVIWISFLAEVGKASSFQIFKSEIKKMTTKNFL